MTVGEWVRVAVNGKQEEEIIMSSPANPAQDPRVMRGAVEKELVGLTPRIEAMRVVMEKMGRVANRLHDVVVDNAGGQGPSALATIAESQMVLIESHLTNLAFQLDAFLDRQSQLQQFLANFDAKVKPAGMIIDPFRKQ